MREFAKNAVPRHLPEHWAQEAAQHEAIAALLGAYIDGELPADTAAQLDGHLAECPRCAREVSLQRALAAGLGQTRGPVVSAALQTRIRQAVAAAPVPHAPPSSMSWGQRLLANWRFLAMLAVLAGGAAAGAAYWRRSSAPGATTVAVATVAVGQDALLDSLSGRWEALATQDLPGRARDLDAVREALGGAVTPLEGNGLSLASAWTTSVNGELLGALAYRHDGRLLLHFIVPATVAMPGRSLRAALDAAPHVTAVRDSLAVVAWRADGGIQVLVARETPDRLRAVALAQLHTSATGRGRP